VKLREVTYNCFDYETVDFASDPKSTSHELDREIILKFDDRPSMYISWDMVAGDYRVALREHSFFDDDFVPVDVSRWEIWRRLLGDIVELNANWAGSQVVQISSDRGSVFVCSRNERNWYHDTLTIQQQPPDWEATDIRVD